MPFTPEHIFYLDRNTYVRAILLIQQPTQDLNIKGLWKSPSCAVEAKSTKSDENWTWVPALQQVLVIYGTLALTG